MPPGRNRSTETAELHLLALAVGLLGGLLGVGFRNGVREIEKFLLDADSPVTADLSTAETLLLPTLGGLGAGLILLMIRCDRGPFGISDLVELVSTRRGRIRPFRSLMQILSSGFSIASGGSIGREGANSQFGATLATVFGQWARLSPRLRSVLLGCGIAAGMASAYRAPIAGAMFVMEVVLGNFAMDVFAPVVVASVASTIVTRHFLGAEAIYEMGALEMTSWPLVTAAAALGALCGFGGPMFRSCLLAGQRAFTAFNAPLPVKMAIGGLIVGVIGLEVPQAWGNGQSTIEVLAEPGAAPGFGLMIGLLLAKLVATSVTAGSGALGGTFTPNLVVGAAFGAAFSRVVDLVAEGDHHTEFALVGMAGLCAATAHAPITAVILVFEMTNDYGLILPLMLCSILSSLVARTIDRDSIYTAKIRAKGHDPAAGLEELAVKRSYVRTIMRRDPESIISTATFDAVLEAFLGSRRGLLYAVDAEGQLQGHLRLHDVKAYLHEGSLGSFVIAQDLARPSAGVRPEQTLAELLPRFDTEELDELPVVEADGRLVGRITRGDLVACIRDEVLGQRALRARLQATESGEEDLLSLPEDTEIARVPIPDAWVGRAVGSLELVESLSVHPLIIVRTDETGHTSRLLADSESVLEENDSVVVLAHRQTIDGLRDGSLLLEDA
ncbi:MAG: chloride channel protein [Planctomycetota bacterium]